MKDRTNVSVTITKDDTGKISNYAEVLGQKLGIICPTIDTAILYIRGSNDKGATSGRLQKEDGSGDFSTASGTGGMCVTIPMHFPYRWIAVEASATQTTTSRIFTIVGKE